MESNVSRPVRFSAGALLACCACVAATPGCITPAQSRRDGLVRVAHEFNDGMRWRRAEQITPRLPPDEVQSFLARMATLADDFEMADHEVTSIAFGDNGARAAVGVEFTWYNQRRSLLRHTVVGQDWRFLDGQWICAKQTRLSGDRLPLILEPASARGARARAPADNSPQPERSL